MSDLIERAMGFLRDKYVFPEKGAAAADVILERSRRGDYAGLDGAELGVRLTEELYELCGDRHLRVRERQSGPSGDPEEAWRAQQRRSGYGIARVERLAGNVGLIELTGITGARAGGRAIAAAMELVAETEALILDLRPNRGGMPDGVVFWASYFFPDGETHLNDIYTREDGRTRQLWSLDWLPGARYLDRPVWVLTSGRTFSGGEDLAYGLQAYGRATVVGERTRGGAHPTEVYPLDDRMEITVPLARSIHPVTGTNWEGTGVAPDIAVPSAEALRAGYAAALHHVIANAADPVTVEAARAALTDTGTDQAG